MSEIKLLPHNKEIVERIEKAMVEGNHKIFYTEATGLGKSFIFMYLVHKYFRDKKVLYICPKNHIWYNMNGYKEFELIKDCVTFTCNADFNKIKPRHKGFDAIFIDEAHHLTSPIQGENISKLAEITIKDNPNAYIFGFTATPNVDNCMIGDKYFEVSVIGLDLLEAIEKGILQKINYAVAIKDDIIISQEEKNLVKKFNIETTSATITNVTSQYSNVKHWLVYFSFIDELNENIPYFEKYFPEFKLFIIHSDIGNSDQIIKEFETYDGKAILASVSMVLEGIHPKSVEGILLYRNVHSNNTFLQIIGRLGIINPKVNPIFVDIYSSYDNFITSNIVKETCGNDIFDNNFIPRKYIYMSSTTYKFIELTNLLYKLRYNKYVYSYRGYEWRTINELANKLGKSFKYVYKRLCKGMTFEEIIDETFTLGDCRTYRGYEWTSDIDLSIKLGRHDHYVYEKRSNGMTYEQIIDDIIDKSRIKSYGNYTWKTDTELSRKLGKHDNYVHQQLKAGLTYEQIIDKTVKSYSYREFTWTTRKELADKLGVTPQYIKYHLDKGNTYEQVIDHVIDKPDIKIYRGYKLTNISDIAKSIGKTYHYVYSRVAAGQSYEDIIDEYLEKDQSPKSYRGFTWLHDSDLSSQLGYTYNYVSMSRHNGKTYEQIIDKCLDNPRYNQYEQGNKSYRGYEWKSDRDLSIKLGKYEYYVSSLLKTGLTYEQIIDNAIRGPEIKSYRGYEWNNDRDLSIKLGKHENYVYRKRTKGMTYEQIIDKIIDGSKIKSYRGYEWNNDRDLSIKLGKHENYVYRKRTKGMTYEQIIDACFDTYSLEKED